MLRYSSLTPPEKGKPAATVETRGPNATKEPPHQAAGIYTNTDARAHAQPSAFICQFTNFMLRSVLGPKPWSHLQSTPTYEIVKGRPSRPAEISESPPFGGHFRLYVSTRIEGISKPLSFHDFVASIRHIVCNSRSGKDSPDRWPPRKERETTTTGQHENAL